MGQNCCKGNPQEDIISSQHPYLKICIIPVPLNPPKETKNKPIRTETKNVFSKNDPIILELWYKNTNFPQNKEGIGLKNAFYCNTDCIVIEINSENADCLDLISTKEVESELKEIDDDIFRRTKQNLRIYILIKQGKQLKTTEQQVIDFCKVRGWQYLKCNDNEREIDASYRTITEKMTEDGVEPRVVKKELVKMEDDHFEKEYAKMNQVKRRTSLFEDPMDGFNNARTKRYDNLFKDSIVQTTS